MLLEVFLQWNRKNSSHKAGNNTCSPGSNLVKTKLITIPWGISYKLLPQQRYDDMNLWLKDSAKKRRRVFTGKQEAKEDAILHLQATALYLWLQHELCLYNYSNFGTKSVQRLSFGHIKKGIFIDFGHAVYAFSLLSVSQVLFPYCGQLSLSTTQCMPWASVGYMSSIPYGQPDSWAWPISNTSSASIWVLGYSFGFSFANEVKWKPLKFAQSQRLGHSSLPLPKRKLID